jgi:predicted nucleic acid-binding protein
MTNVSRQIAILDTNILYSAGTRDIFLQLATYERFVPKWSTDIRRELMNTYRNNRPDIAIEKLESMWSEMNHYFPDSMITGYEHLVVDLDLPDPHDRHILAAAIHGNCNVIVTQNIKDFPAARTDPLGIYVCSADDFLMMMFTSYPLEFIESIRAMLARLQSPSYSVAQYLQMRARDGLTQVAAELCRRAHLLESTR